MKTIYDFWVFNRESIFLACVIALPSGALFAIGHELAQMVIKKIRA